MNAERNPESLSRSFHTKLSKHDIPYENGTPNQPKTLLNRIETGYPINMKMPNECRDELNRIISKHSNDRQALLPCLRAAQRICGHLSEEIVDFLAEKLSLSKAEVYGTATFYSMLSFEKQGKHVVRVCTSLPCYLKESDWILGTLKELGIEESKPTPDGKFTLQTVSCLGLCDQAPAMMVNEKSYGNLTPEKVKQIINQYRRK